MKNGHRAPLLPSVPHAAWRGFSLTEVIIAVSIIVILATLLVPLVRSALSTAASVNCSNNMRQIYTLAMIFKDDHNGLLPPSLVSSDNRQYFRDNIHPEFGYNAYWWHQAYLGRYLLDQPHRRRDSAGRLSQDEVLTFNCPERFLDGPDESFPASSGNPAISYLMNQTRSVNGNWGAMLRMHEAHSAGDTVFLTEGRGSHVHPSALATGPFGSPHGAGRIRRYHNNGVFITYYNGNIERFTGTDQELAQKLRVTADSF